jgi:hypothetical protein
MRSSVSPRRPFFKQGSFYGGLVAGFALFPLLIAGTAWIFTHHAAASAASTASSGNVTIQVNDDVLTIGMRAGLLQVQNQLPFTLKNVTAKTSAGDTIALHADGPSIVGSAPIGMDVTLSPTVNNKGQIDFRVTDLMVAGIDVSLFGLTTTALENTLNQQFSNLGQGSLVNGLTYQLENVHTIKGALVLNAKLVQASP